jgi:threonine/homoserine/homoserine lactone efflux protein
MPQYLIFGMTYAFAAAVQPGPFQAFLLSQTSRNGWRRTLPAAFAPLVSDGPIILLVLLVLSRVPGWLVTVLQGAGGLFLLFLAYGAWTTWRRGAVPPAASGPDRQQTLLKAALVNLLNPNPYLGWSLVMGPLLLKGWREAPANGLALLAGFYSTLVVSTMGIILLFGLAGSFGPKVSRILVGISALALAAFGVYELWLAGGALWRR